MTFSVQTSKKRYNLKKVFDLQIFFAVNGSKITNANCLADSSGNGSPGSWTSPLSSPVGTGRPPSLMDHPHSLPNAVRVVVTRDAGGYGMKVSGDNPVYVQSVKDGKQILRL